jgi:single-stranded-DNA-specific exonuclease
MTQIKNLKKAAARIRKAIESNEKIILYGDSDLDGVTSVIIAKEAISSLGGKVTAIYFPDREKEGYGLTESALFFLKEYAPALLITFDLGISSFKEVAMAKKLGFEVIIIDHHEVLDKLPKASIIVDPKQKGEKYPFKGFSNGGLVFKLAEELFQGKMSDSLRKSFLELAALSTIADMMPQEEDNKLLIEEGLTSLSESFRPGIQALLNMEEFDRSDIDIHQKVSKIISILNIRNVKEGFPASFRLLTTFSLQEAQDLVRELVEQNLIKRARIKEIVVQVEIEIAGKKELPLIFEGNSSWELELLGAAASIIAKEHQKPTFLFKKMENESHGSVRSAKGIDTVALMKKCQKHLLSFGGHPPASGFRIKNENLEKFKDCLIKNLTY